MPRNRTPKIQTIEFHASQISKRTSVRAIAAAGFMAGVFSLGSLVAGHGHPASGSQVPVTPAAPTSQLVLTNAYAPTGALPPHGVVSPSAKAVSDSEDAARTQFPPLPANQLTIAATTVATTGPIPAQGITGPNS